MGQTIDEFKNAIINGGARPNQFRIKGGFPGNLTSTLTSIAGSAIGGKVGAAVGAIGGAIGSLTGSGAGQKLEFLAKAASIPASKVGNIDLNFRGKILKTAGDRDFDPWTLSITNDVSFDLRKAFEEWSNALTSHRSNIGIPSLTYFQDWEVEQLDRNGGVLETYNIRSCWPSEVGAITLSFDQRNTIETFDVTLQYQYWEHKGSTT